MKKKESFLERYFPHLITLGLILIIVSGGLAYYEFHGAKRFCNSVNGVYNLDFFPLPPKHYCDDKLIIAYNDGWDFQKADLTKINISSIPLW